MIRRPFKALKQLLGKSTFIFVHSLRTTKKGRGNGMEAPLHLLNAD